VSERPTDASIAYDWKLVRLKTDAEEGPTMASVRLEEELQRARRVEKEQAETIDSLQRSHDVLERQRNEQAETITDLVDALALDGMWVTPKEWHHRDCLRLRHGKQCAAHCVRVAGALRLVGRLP
jgi:hypothetical protein